MRLAASAVGEAAARLGLPLAKPASLRDRAAHSCCATPPPT
jgi:hypothetical protein